MDNLRHCWRGPEHVDDAPWCQNCTGWFARQREWPEMLFRWERAPLKFNESDEDIPRDGRAVWFDDQFDWYLALRDKFEAALESLSGRRYWTRRWIVQELNLPPRQAVTIRWGVYSFSRTWFESILMILTKDNSASKWQPAQYMLQEFHSGDLLQLMIAAQHTHCFDPRDRIYALLSMVNDPPISPGKCAKVISAVNSLTLEDYTVPASALYLHYATLLVRQQEIVLLLSACSGLQDDSVDWLAAQLPSWVPDLRRQLPGTIATRKTKTAHVDSGCTFNVNHQSLICHWHFVGMCRHTPVSISDRDDSTQMPAEAVPHEGERGQGTDLDEVMWEIQCRYPAPSLYATEYKGHSQMPAVFWPHEHGEAMQIDAAIERDRSVPQHGDMLCSLQPPQRHFIGEFDEDYNHVAYPYILRPVDGSSGRYLLRGRCSVLYRDAAPPPSELRTCTVV